MKNIGILIGLTALGVLSAYALVSMYYMIFMLIPLVMTYGILPPTLKGMMILGGMVGLLIGFHKIGVRLYLKD